MSPDSLLTVERRPSHAVVGLDLALARAAVTALHDELKAYPKPGLVSPIDSGAHADMDFALMVPVGGPRSWIPSRTLAASGSRGALVRGRPHAARRVGGAPHAGRHRRRQHAPRRDLRSRPNRSSRRADIVGRPPIAGFRASGSARRVATCLAGPCVARCRRSQPWPRSPGARPGAMVRAAKRLSAFPVSLASAFRLTARHSKPARTTMPPVSRRFLR